jgi:hypothetical protein
MAMRGPGPEEVTGWVAASTREQDVAFKVTDGGTVEAAVALLREGRRPRRIRAARPGGSG